MRAPVLLAAMALSVCSTANAQPAERERRPMMSPPPPPPPPSYRVIYKPDWVRKPSDKDMDRAFPQRARSRVRDATVVISCRVKADGHLEECRVVSEHPGDYGFGDAALALAPKYQMSPATADGQTVAGAVVRVPLKFLNPDA